MVMEPRYLPTSSQALNQLLGGWLYGVPSMIFGQAGVGKTTLIMDAIINAYDPEVRQCFYIIDTEDGFMIPRFLQICRSRGIDEAILDRLRVFRPATFEDQDYQIGELPKLVKGSKETPALFAVDSLVWHYHLKLSGVPAAYMATQSRRYIAKMAKQIEVLTQLARQYECPLLVVTWPRSELGKKIGQLTEEDVQARIRNLLFADIETRPEILGGRGLLYAAKLVLRVMSIAPTPTGEIVGVLSKHALKPSHYFTFYRLTDKGIEDVEDDSKRSTFFIEELSNFAAIQVKEKKAKKATRKATKKAAKKK